MSERRGKGGRDPLADIREVQDHRLDPGHFTGGNIHPILRSKRAHWYGYLLLASGFVGVFLLGHLIRSGQMWLVAGTALMAAVGIVAGLSLIRRGRAAREDSRSRHE
ncbi:MAG TPA: hypothetical protein VGH97_11920 [Thermoanaerobaculia bacterium]|jgi:hypothetical protein